MLPDCISNLYSFQPPLLIDTEACASVCPDWSATSAMVSGSEPSRHRSSQTTSRCKRAFGLHSDSPVAFVDQTGGAARVGLQHSSLALLLSAAEGPSFASTLTLADAFPFSSRNQLRMPGPIGAKGPIPNQLGVQAAVVGVVDLLGHQAVKCRADRRLRMLQIDSEAYGRLPTENRSGDKTRQSRERKSRVKVAHTSTTKLIIRAIACTFQAAPI